MVDAMSNLAKAIRNTLGESGFADYVPPFRHGQRKGYLFPGFEPIYPTPILPYLFR
jgi:hypothetical protein